MNRQMANAVDAKFRKTISVQIVDPPAWTLPYDHALSAGLARAGARVELVTTEFPLSPVHAGSGYAVSERFYRGAAKVPGEVDGGLARTARRALKLAEHVPDMLLYRRHAARADVVHFQWVRFPVVDVRLLPPHRPLVFTAHDVPPREPRRGDRHHTTASFATPSSRGARSHATTPLEGDTGRCASLPVNDHAMRSQL